MLVDEINLAWKM